MQDFQHRKLEGVVHERGRLAGLSYPKLDYIFAIEKINPHINMPGLGLMKTDLNIILRRQLSSISTFGYFTALRDQKPACVCTFKMVQIQLVALICLSCMYGLSLIRRLAAKEAVEIGACTCQPHVFRL